MNLGKNVVVRTGLDHAEGATDRNGAGFDTAGLDGVMIITKFGDIAAGATTNVHAEQSSDDGSADAYADLTGTAITVAADDDNQIFIIDVYRPRERYVRGVVDKDTSNNTEEMMIYIGYQAGKKPTTQDLTDEVTYELHVSPAEGTA